MIIDERHGVVADRRLLGVRAAVATKHDKTPTIARALAPVGLRLETALVDTDTLGTFTPETPRRASARDTAIAKARWACAESGLGVGIGSEGSFFPHPEVGLVTMQIEHVALLHAKSGPVVVGTALGPAAWAMKRIITVDTDLDAFGDILRCGAQRLIVRPSSGDTTSRDSSAHIVKGITTGEQLRRTVEELIESSGCQELVVESDLRAHHCRPRHELIHAAAQDLALRLRTCCPRCGSIGYGCEEVRTGAPCAWCATPTATPHQRVDACPACRHTNVTTLEGSAPADPGTCPECNP